MVDLPEEEQSAFPEAFLDPLPTLQVPVSPVQALHGIAQLCGMFYHLTLTQL